MTNYEEKRARYIEKCEAIEIPYKEYKNNSEYANCIKGEYNAEKKTIIVYVERKTEEEIKRDEIKAQMIERLEIIKKSIQNAEFEDIETMKKLRKLLTNTMFEVKNYFKK